MSEISPELRASDTDRDRVAKLLQEHFAQGRLDSEEFSGRLESAYQARTRGELELITEDLPERDLAALPVETPVRPVRHPAPAGGGAVSALRDPALIIPWLLWGGVNTLCFSVWLILLLTGTPGGAYPWFLWVLGPWGIVMAFITIGVVATRGTGTEPTEH